MPRVLAASRRTHKFITERQAAMRLATYYFLRTSVNHELLRSLIKRTSSTELLLIRLLRSSRGEPSRRTEVLPILRAGLFIFEPVFVLLAVGHGGTFK